MNDETRYEALQKARHEAWENLCTRCGACCGAADDPCENLRRDSNGKYFCAVYEKRFGIWHTVSGKELVCVPLRVKLSRGESWPGDEHCGYKKS